MGSKDFGVHDVLTDTLKMRFGIDYGTIVNLIEDVEGLLYVIDDPNGIYVGERVESIDTLIDTLSTFMKTSINQSAFMPGNYHWLYNNLGHKSRNYRRNYQPDSK